MNASIRVISLYRTVARCIQTFVLCIGERGNWLSVRVANGSGYELETHRGAIINELTRMVQRSNHIGRGKPESTKVAATGRDVEPILLAMFLPLTPEETDSPGNVTFRKSLSAVPKSLGKSHAQSAVGTQPFMACDFGKPVAVAGLLDQRYTVRYPFSVTAEILELETGARLGGVTSDLSLRGCFVRTTSILEVRARVRLTLARKKQKVEIFAAIRRAAQTGMGLEFLDIDPVSNAILLSWIESLGKSG